MDGEFEDVAENCQENDSYNQDFEAANRVRKRKMEQRDKSGLGDDDPWYPSVVKKRIATGVKSFLSYRSLTPAEFEDRFGHAAADVPSAKQQDMPMPNPVKCKGVVMLDDGTLGNRGVSHQMYTDDFVEHT